MADKQDTTQDFDPKHRVVGAIVLVALAVILVPLILHDRAPPAPAQPIAETPAADTRLVVTPLSPVPLPENQPVPATIKTIPSLVAPATTPTTERPSARVMHEPASTAPTNSIGDAPLPAKTATAAVGKGWIVQVGAFSHADNAARLKENLVRHGYAPELDKISLNQGQGVRVRVGPYTSETDARTTQARLQRELGIKGVVRAYP